MDFGLLLTDILQQISTNKIFFFGNGNKRPHPPQTARKYRIAFGEVDPHRQHDHFSLTLSNPQLVYSLISVRSLVYINSTLVQKKKSEYENCVDTLNSYGISNWQDLGIKNCELRNASLVQVQYIACDHTIKCFTLWKISNIICVDLKRFTESGSCAKLLCHGFFIICLPR